MWRGGDLSTGLLKFASLSLDLGPQLTQPPCPAPGQCWAGLLIAVSVRCDGVGGGLGVRGGGGGRGGAASGMRKPPP